jgi:hypothetical protein
MHFAGSQLAVFQGANEHPYLNHTGRVSNAEKQPTGPGPEGCDEMGGRLRCSSVTYRFRYAPLLAPCRRPILIATKYMLFRGQDTSTSSGLRPRDAVWFLFDLCRRRKWIGGLQLAELLFFLLGLLFDFPLPLFKLIVRFCQFLDPPITTKSPVEAAMASRLSNDPSAAAVCGGIVRFAKRLSLFDLSRCA